MENKKIYIPPLKIQGIKTKLVPAIHDLILNTNFEKWVEPFMGSGVVGFNLAPSNALFCDNNPYIINLYNDIKGNNITAKIAKEFLISEGLKLEKLNEQHYYDIRDRFNKYHNSLDFLFLNRSDFNGMIRFNKKGDFNVPYGHKPKRFSQAYITKICNQINYVQSMTSKNNWIFLCQNFEDTLKDIKTSDIIYCDPPYIGRHVDYYDTWDENSEKELHKNLINTGAKFILSTWHHNKYRKNEYIEKIWKNCNIKTTEHFYFIGAKEINRNSMIEALLYNF